MQVIRTWRAKHDIAKAEAKKSLEEKEELEKDLDTVKEEKKRYFLIFTDLLVQFYLQKYTIT